MLAVAPLVALLALFWGVLGDASFNPAAGAATTGAVNQCNGTDNGGGNAVSCRVTIANAYDVATGAGSSVVTVRQCHGAANVALTCTDSSTPIAHLTTTVTQCDGSGNGGGGVVNCTVRITNTVTGISTTAAATVNQCNGSGTGGGPQPTVVCNPLGNTTNATINQCNNSGTGGGATMRVKCTVTPSTRTSALAVTVNQCNGSGTGGGATVTCTTSIKTLIVAPPVSSSPVSTAPVSTPAVSTPPVSTPAVSTPPVSTPAVSTPPAIGRTPTAGTLTASPSSPMSGGSVVLTVAVTGAGGTPTGTVIFTENGVLLGTATLGSNGHATLTIRGSATSRSASIVAHYNGNSRYAASTFRALQLVVHAGTTGTTAAAAATTEQTTLASTGSDVKPALAAGLLALLVGALMLLTARRPKARHR